MKTMLDYVFEELIEDLEKWHKEYGYDEDSLEEGFTTLTEIMEDYKMSSENSISELQNKKTQQDVDYEEYRNNF